MACESGARACGAVMSAVLLACADAAWAFGSFASSPRYDVKFVSERHGCFALSSLKLVHWDCFKDERT